jgi:hypothetical protein
MHYNRYVHVLKTVKDQRKVQDTMHIIYAYKCMIPSNHRHLFS